MKDKNNLKKKRRKQKRMFFVVAGIIIIIMAGALLLSDSEQVTSTSNPISKFVTSVGDYLTIDQYKNNPELEYFSVTKENGLKICYKDYCVTYLPKFVMEDNTVYDWVDIPPTIEKDLWKTQVAKNKYKYGVDFSNVPDNVKNNLKFVALVRTNATKMVNGSVVPMVASDIVGKIKIQGGSIILNDKVTISHADILSTYSIPVINKTHIVIGNLDNSWIVCDEYDSETKECIESHLEYNWKDNGDGTWNITFDPTITIDEVEVITDSLLTNVTAETGDANFTHLNISTTAPYDSLVGYWNFDGDLENTLTTTHYDFTNYGIDGTGVGNVNTTSTGCLTNMGNCLQFDGTGDYVVTASTTSLDMEEDMTIMAWVNRKTSATEAIVTFGGASGVGYEFFTQTGGAIALYDGVSINAEAIINNNVWNHVVASIKEDNVTFYINGNEVGGGGAWTLDLAGTQPLWIGTWNTASEFWNGVIDEVMIFNTSLTSAQISAIYNNQSARFLQQGTQKVRAVNITDTTLWQDSGYNRVNLTTTYQTNFKSNISARIGQFNLSVDPDGLVLFMPFEWGSAVDISGNGNDGTIVNAVFNETGGLNETGGFKFDGADDYIDLGDINSMDNLTAITMSGWIKYEKIVDIYPIVSKFDSKSAGVANWKIYAQVNADVNFVLYAVALYDSVGGSHSVSTGWVASDTSWHYVVGVYNGTYVKLYVDGVEKGTPSAMTGNTLDSVTKVVIGANPYEGTFETFANGSIDDVMVFNRSLSANEISALYYNSTNKYNVPYYTDYQNITGDDEFTIDTEADFIFPDFLFHAGNLTSKFYSPLLQGDIVLDTWSVSVGVTPDTEDPKVYLIAPVNETSGSTQTHSFNTTFTDDNNVSNATYYLWNSTGTNINLTSTSLGDTTSESWNLSVTLPYVDTFKWNVYACDGSHNCAFNSTNFTITYSTADTCTCAGVDTNWQIDMSDYCNITTDCNLGTGKLNWTGSGQTNCSATINTTNMAEPNNINQLLLIGKDCIINIFSWIHSIINKPMLPLVQALSISDTNFSNSGSGNMVQVDYMTLTELIINNTAIELYNVSSIGTNFTNVNSTSNSSIYFYGLLVNLAVFHVDNSNYLFNSTVALQNYGATFETKNILRILSILLTEYSRILAIIPNVELSIPYVKLNETLYFIDSSTPNIQLNENLDFT